MLAIMVHNISSAQRLIEIAKLIFNYTTQLEVQTLILSKVTGSAAQSGIPEVSKLAYKHNRSVLIVNEIKEAVELIKPEKVFIVTTAVKSTVKIDEVASLAKRSRILLIFPGTEEAFPKHDLTLGIPFNIEGISEKIGVVPYISITLHEIIKQLNR
ncbi:MAG: exonuclease [Desulfurococcales archaeon ex4484_217_1]|nr:MAG: exonuclease [Desulfurococcales archaeon ex4484_217_1]